MIAAIRRLDKGKVCAARAQLRPVDVGLPAGHIHAVNLEMTGLDAAEVDWLFIAEA